MRKLGLKINTMDGSVTDLADSPLELPEIVCGDHVLFCCQFLEALASTVSNMDLSGADALILTIKEDRLLTDTTELTSQSDYNQGEYPAYEALATGKVTWLVTFNTAALISALGSAESLDVWCEFTLCDKGRKQTLGQTQLTIVPNLYDGTIPASTPTPTPTPTPAP